MWPVIGAAVAGGLSLLGGERSNRANRAEAEKSRAFTSAEAKRQMGFQERMRNTSWQAGVEDMRRAGLNPALAYSQGGAASPGGAMGAGAQAQQEDIVSPAVSSAQHASRLKQELKNLAATEEESKARAGRVAVENAFTINQGNLVDAQRHGVQLQNELMGLQMHSARNIARLEQTKFGQFMPYIERTGRAVSPVVTGGIGALIGRAFRPKTPSAFFGPLSQERKK